LSFNEEEATLNDKNHLIYFQFSVMDDFIPGETQLKEFFGLGIFHHN